MLQYMHKLFYKYILPLFPETEKNLRLSIPLDLLVEVPFPLKRKEKFKVYINKHKSSVSPRNQEVGKIAKSIPLKKRDMVFMS